MKTNAMFRGAGLALTSALAMLPACAMDELTGEDDDGELAVDELELTGGTLVTSNVAPFNSVVRIRAAGFLCSGTKIGARRFLTAAHCFESLAAGDAISITNSLAGTFSASDEHRVTAIRRHPTWTNDPDNATGFDNSRAFDVEIIDIDEDTAGIPALGVRAAYLGAGTSGTTIGYGCDNAAGSNNDGKKQRATFTSISLADYTAATPESDELAFSKHTYNAVFDGGADIQTCPGDSGGPQLVRNADGVWQVAAITSNHNSLFSWQARVGGASRWIASQQVNSFVAGAGGFLVNGKSNLCIGVDGGSTEPDAGLGQYYCDGRNRTADNQFWQLVANGDSDTFRLKNGKSGLCLGVSGGSTAHGARLAQYECEPLNGHRDNQSWTFEQNSPGKFRIVNGKSDRCIGVDGASTARGANVTQFTCDGFANQGWIFTR